jgi:hypothetical protein
LIDDADSLCHNILCRLHVAIQVPPLSPNLPYILLSHLPSIISFFLPSFHFIFLSYFSPSSLLFFFCSFYFSNVTLGLLRLYSGSKTENQTRKRYPVSSKKVTKATFYLYYFMVHIFRKVTKERKNGMELYESDS